MRNNSGKQKDAKQWAFTRFSGISEQGCSWPHPSMARVRAIAVIAGAALVGFGTCPGDGAPKSQSGAAFQTAYFGPLSPGKVGTPSAVALPFHLSISDATAARGYRATAVSSFTFTPATSAAGGKTITAADIGVGVVGASSTFGALGNAVIATGLDYDPSAVSGNSKASRNAGAIAERATLADLLSGREIVRIGKVHPGTVPPGQGDLILTVKVAVPTQYFTPGSFSGSITLIVVQ